MQSCLDNRASGWQRVAARFGDVKLVRVALTLVMGALGSIPLVLLTPPFQVPDEVQHFYRAYQLSDFQIRAEVQQGISGGTLPASLPLLVKSSVSTPDGGIHYPAVPAPLADTMKHSSIPLDSTAKRFVAFPGSAFYSPLPYLPQVIGITLGRLLGCGPLYLLYFGRLFNCLAALAVVGLAVYFMPVAADLVLIIGLLPMSLYLFASVSPDASVIACALLFTALSFAASSRGNWKAWELVNAALAAAVFCSVKPPYAPIVLAGLIPGLVRRDKAASVIRAHAILIAVTVGAASVWLLFAKSSMTSPLDGSHPSLQMSFVLHHPTSFITALIHTLRMREVGGLYFSTVGIFGWLSVFLRPVFVYFLPLVSFGIIWSVGARGSTPRSFLRAIWYLALALASALLIMLALYLIGAHVGLNEITGLQGRYFIPILVLAGMAAIELAPRGPATPAWQGLATIAGIIGLQILATDTTIIRAFDVF